jgi:hypothetical protein
MPAWLVLLSGSDVIPVFNSPTGDRNNFLPVRNLKYHPVRTATTGRVVAFKDVSVGKFPVGVVPGWISVFHNVLNEFWANLWGFLLVLPTVLLASRQPSELHRTLFG